MIPVSRPSVGEKELMAVGEVFNSGWLGMGSTVSQLENELCNFLGAEHAVTVCNGTSGLFLALHAAGIGAGDQVIVPSLTYVASIQAISATGAIPVFCDVRESDLNMDPEDVRSLITSKTAAIMPVHYRGVPCDMNSLMEITKGTGIRIVEDAAHAFGSLLNGRLIGSFGDITCFSFDPIKVITCGEGGAVITKDPELAGLMQQKRMLGIDKDTLSRYRNQRSWMYDVLSQGYRFHMSNINASIGLVQLARFEELRDSRRRIAEMYDDALAGMKKIGIIPTDYSGISPFMYIVKVWNMRDKLIAFLKERGIGTGIHYLPAHRFTFYRHLARELPVTEKAAAQILTLPLYPDMTRSDAGMVIEALQEWERV